MSFDAFTCCPFHVIHFIHGLSVSFRICVFSHRLVNLTLVFTPLCQNRPKRVWLCPLGKRTLTLILARSLAHSSAQCHTKSWLLSRFVSIVDDDQIEADSLLHGLRPAIYNHLLNPYDAFELDEVLMDGLIANASKGKVILNLTCSQ